MKEATSLVMIHGLMGSLDFYAPGRRFGTRAVHTLDMIGYGQLKDDIPTPITLANQAAHVIRYLHDRVDGRCVLLGHSVGGAIAMLVAALAPEKVRGVINVEGNFTLADAFWCAKIARLDEAEWRSQYQNLVADPEGWLKSSGISVTPQRSEWAHQILTNQPCETIQAMAHAVVEETGSPRYLEQVRRVVERGTSLFLLAGERSASGWDLPDWVRSSARSSIVQKGVGHMMMLEQPDEFCNVVSQMLAELEQG